MIKLHISHTQYLGKGMGWVVIGNFCAQKRVLKFFVCTVEISKNRYFTKKTVKWEPKIFNAYAPSNFL